MNKYLSVILQRYQFESQTLERLHFEHQLLKEAGRIVSGAACC
jgi:hypothetical protein